MAKKHSGALLRIQIFLLGVLLFALILGVRALHGRPKPEITPPGVPLSSLPGPVAKAASRVYKFSIYNICAENSFVGGGSAIILENTILTARHIFDGLQSGIEEGSPTYCFIQEFISSNGSDTIYAPLRLPDYKLFKDIVRIHADEVTPQSDPQCFSLNYAVGDSIYILGYPGDRGRAFTALKNQITGTYQIGFGRYIISRGGLAGKGMSGGAVIDARGCIIGILVLADPRTHLNYSIPFTGVEDWLR